MLRDLAQFFLERSEKILGPIRARWAKKGEELETLDGIKRTLSPTDLVIADDVRVLSLAGVMGGAYSEISATTTRVCLEAAHFNPIDIARVSRRHKLSSEASRRLERGVDQAGRQAQARAGEHGGAFCAQVAQADLRRFLSGRAGPDEYQTLADLPPIPASFDGPDAPLEAEP